MKTLPIVWQRLVSASGTTCPRCQGTHEEADRALAHLKIVLEPLGVLPTLELREIDDASFQARPSESNRIWVAGKPLEEWIGARVGHSRCCDECGDQDCRTAEVEGTTYEVIPQQLLVRAALIAATRMTDPSLAEAGETAAP